MRRDKMNMRSIQNEWLPLGGVLALVFQPCIVHCRRRNNRPSYLPGIVPYLPCRPPCDLFSWFAGLGNGVLPIFLSSAALQPDSDARLIDSWPREYLSLFHLRLCLPPQSRLTCQASLLWWRCHPWSDAVSAERQSQPLRDGTHAPSILALAVPCRDSFADQQDRCVEADNVK